MKKITVLSFITLDGVMQALGSPEEDTSGGFHQISKLTKLSVEEIEALV